MDETHIKLIIWIGSSYEDWKDFPDEVKMFGLFPAFSTMRCKAHKMQNG